MSMGSKKRSIHLQGIQVVDPGLAAEGGGDELAQGRVAEGQPAAGGDAVGLVLELQGPQVGKLLEDGFPDDVRVDGRHPVDSMARHHCQVRHPHIPAQQALRYLPPPCNT